MARHFRSFDVDQPMLVAPDLRELVGDDVVWTVREIVAALDISELEARYRRGGRGRMAYDPRMLLLLWIYAAMNGIFSTRKIEAACRRDVAFMAIVGVGAQARVPDHSTLSRFIAKNDAVIDDLFAQVLRLCAALGMVRAGVIAVDGTKVAANASFAKSFTGQSLVHQLSEADAEVAAAEVAEQEAAVKVARQLRLEQVRVDEAEDAAEAARRRAGDDGDGQGLTPELKKLKTAQARRDKIQAAVDDLAARKAAAEEAMRSAQGAKQAAWDSKVAAAGTSAGLGPRPRDEVRVGRAGREAAPRASVVDVDSRRMKTSKGNFVQGYNVQAAVASDPGGPGDQIVLATAVVQEGTDHHQLPAVVDAVRATLATLQAPGPSTATSTATAGSGLSSDSSSGSDLVLGTVVADAGYANEETFAAMTERGVAVLAPLASDQAQRLGGDPGGGRSTAHLPHTDAAQQQLRTQVGKATYARRGCTVEPFFGQVKGNLGLAVMRRRGLMAARAQVAFTALVHNALKMTRKVRAEGVTFGQAVAAGAI